MTAPGHVPVLETRIVELLSPALAAPGAVAVDATVGLGGHAAALLRRNPNARLIGLDRDPDALAVARRRLAEFGDSVTLVHTGYDAIADALDDLGLDLVSTVLFDLGVSSLQLDTDDRGFAYSRNTVLDMRMDRSGGVTAAEVVNDYDAERLAGIFRRYGEERFAGRIAAAIVTARRERPLTTTGELTDAIASALPAAARRSATGHPAKRVFQALRIEVNDELGQLQRALPAAIGKLQIEGRVAVLSYHSLEDRLVKRELARRAREQTPIDVPLRASETQPELELLTLGAEKAPTAEIAANPRAASVRLRAAKRLRSMP